MTTYNVSELYPQPTDHDLPLIDYSAAPTNRPVMDYAKPMTDAEVVAWFDMLADHDCMAQGEGRTFHGYCLACADLKHVEAVAAFRKENRYLGTEDTIASLRAKIAA